MRTRKKLSKRDRCLRVERLGKENLTRVSHFRNQSRSRHLQVKFVGVEMRKEEREGNGSH